MAAFLTTQLDFILFFYGLAFLLLGIVSLTIANGTTNNARYIALGAFGIIHGGSEWLDLVAVIGGDSPAFASIRTAVMIVSFVALVEAARREAIRRELPFSGLWIHAVLLLPVAAMWQWGGYADANPMARYSLCLPAAAAMALTLAWFARKQTGSIRRWALFSMVGFARPAPSCLKLHFGLRPSSIRIYFAASPEFPCSCCEGCSHVSSHSEHGAFGNND